MVAGLRHPQRGEKVSGTNKATNTAASNTAPVQSIRARRPGAPPRSRPSARSNRQPAAMVRIAMGTLMKKIQRQLCDVGDEPADHRPQREAHVHGGDVEAQRPAPLRRREGGRDDTAGRREHERPADPLDAAADDHHPGPARHPATTEPTAKMPVPTRLKATGLRVSASRPTGIRRTLATSR